MPPQQPRRKPPAADHSGPRIDDHRLRPQRRSPRAVARPRGRQTPASRTQSRLRPEAAQNRQNPHCPRWRRSPNATGGVLSDFSRGSGVYTLQSIAAGRPRPASEGEESDTAARSKRRRRRMPAQDQSRGRQKRSHQKQIDAGIIAQPAAQQRPHHAAATRRVRRAARHGSIPRTLRAALSVPHAGAVRTTAPRVPRPAPHGSFLTRSAPPYQSSVPPGAWPSRSARTGAPMPQPGLVLSAGRRARKNSAAPHTRQRPPPLAVKCAELPPLPQRSTGRRNPIPQHPHSATNRIARRCGASPPTSRASVAGGANLAFADPRHPGARPTCVRRATAPRVPRRKPGEPVKGCSITGRAANGRRPPQAVQTLFAVPHQVAARPACARRTSCHRNQGEKRMNPVMQVPCQNRPHLLPTGRWSGGRMRRRAMR